MAIFCSSFRGNLVPIVFFAIFNLSFNDAKMANLGSADFPGGRGRCQEYSVASLNMKNLMSPTPRN